MRTRGALLLLCALHAACAAGPSPALKQRLQAAIAERAAYWNCSMSFALSWGNATVAAAAGVQDRATGARITTEDKVPMGSVTKTYVATAVMRLVDAGRVTVDDPVHRYADPILKSTNGSTLLDIFGDPRVNDMTLGQLMSMRGGLQDYDDTAMKQWTIFHPASDFSPLDYLWSINHTLLCDPGTCGSYSSIGFVILGFALVHLSGAQRWQDYDQAAAIPTNVPHSMTRFTDAGPCSRYPDIVHQYMAYQKPGQTTYSFLDFDDYSCLNGWTMGNIAAAPLDVASFYYALLSPNAAHPLVTAESRARMTNFRPLTVGWSVGLLYGFGLMNYTKGAPTWLWSDMPFNATGHGGADWGSIAQVTAYDLSMDVGVTFAVGSASGLNESLGQLNGAAYVNTFCHLWNILRADYGLKTYPCPGTSTKPDGLSCVCSADQEVCPYQVPPIEPPYNCAETFYNIETQNGITCNDVASAVHKQSPDEWKATIAACCAPPGKCKGPFGSCVCPAGSTYMPENPVNWDMPYTCETVLRSVSTSLGGADCSATAKQLQLAQKLYATQVSCCTPPPPPPKPAGSCICGNNESAYIPNAVISWNKPWTCEQTMSYLMQNNSATCKASEAWLEKASELYSTQLSCCSPPPPALGDCLCRDPAEYTPDAVMQWNPPHSCEATMESLMGAKHATCGETKLGLALEKLLANTTASCCRRSAAPALSVRMPRLHLPLKAHPVRPLRFRL